MTDYNKALNTIKAIADTFGSSEFTRRDYEEMKKDHVTKTYVSPTFGETNKPLAYDVYSSSRALDLDDRPLVKKVREEEVWVKTDDSTKKKAKRYYYQIDTDALTRTIKWMLKNAQRELKYAQGKREERVEIMERDERIMHSREEKIAELDRKIARAKDRTVDSKDKLNAIDEKIEGINNTMASLKSLL